MQRKAGDFGSIIYAVLCRLWIGKDYKRIGKGLNTTPTERGQACLAYHFVPLHPVGAGRASHYVWQAGGDLMGHRTLMGLIWLTPARLEAVGGTRPKTSGVTVYMTLKPMS